MITLATLEQATVQEVFDQVATHLLTQNKKSANIYNGQCRYRSEGGLSCAAGCLMSDKEYHPSMEGTKWSSIVSAEGITVEHVNLICWLQTIHDKNTPESWKHHLLKIAAYHDLSPDAVNNFKPLEITS